MVSDLPNYYCESVTLFVCEYFADWCLALFFENFLSRGFSAFEKEKMSQAMIADKQPRKKRPLTGELISYAAHGMCLLVRSKVKIIEK